MASFRNKIRSKFLTKLYNPYVRVPHFSSTCLPPSFPLFTSLQPLEPSLLLQEHTKLVLNFRILHSHVFFWKCLIFKFPHGYLFSTFQYQLLLSLTTVGKVVPILPLITGFPFSHKSEASQILALTFFWSFCGLYLS